MCGCVTELKIANKILIIVTSGKMKLKVGYHVRHVTLYSKHYVKVKVNDVAGYGAYTFTEYLFSEVFCEGHDA